MAKSRIQVQRTADQLAQRVIREGAGKPPAVVLINPKFGRNIAAALRACSCFGVEQLWWTGNRASFDETRKGKRLPREERMKGYGDVELCHGEYYLDAFTDATPVAVEIRPNSEPLPEFEHPENAVYIFGPEDGTLGRKTLQHCHRFVKIPARHCLNLATAVTVILYDRIAKQGGLVLPEVEEPELNFELFGVDGALSEAVG